MTENRLPLISDGDVVGFWGAAWRYSRFLGNDSVLLDNEKFSGGNCPEYFGSHLYTLSACFTRFSLRSLSALC